MPASRRRVRGVASARAAGACQATTLTSGARSLSRWRSRGVATPTATAPQASERRAREPRKTAPRIRNRADVGEIARMHIQPRRAIIFVAAFAALALAATAWADSGTQTAPDNGGTVAGEPTAVEKSGGVAGPQEKEEEKPARSAQTTTSDEPPQVETTPTYTAPTDNSGQEPGATNTTPNEGAGTAPTAGTG